MKYYEGTPIPSSLLLVVVLGIAFGTHATNETLWLGTLPIGPWDFHPLVLMYGISARS